MRPQGRSPHLPLHPPEFVAPIWEDRQRRGRVVTVAGAVVLVIVGIQLALSAKPGDAFFQRGFGEPRSGLTSTLLSGGKTFPSREATHIEARSVPRNVRAIYLTSWSAATPSRLREAVMLARTTEVNGVIVDIKDYTGTVVFATTNPMINGLHADTPRVDLRALVDQLHGQGIYVIARIVAFQDQHLLAIKPYLAVRDPQGHIWRDRKGLGWVDPASLEVWQYLVEIGREAARAGADELNFDYVRFPSDGALSDLRYSVYDEQKESRRQVIRRFFEYLTTELRPTGAVLSADLFGLATVRPDDLGVGQVIEDAFLYFDYVSPMVYPSHYARGFLQYANPADHPYEVVRYSLARAEHRRAAYARMLGSIAAETGTPNPIDHIAKIRPWLQAFDMGALYPPPVIRRQIDAVHAAGVTTGWFLWNPSNRYEPATFDPSPSQRTSSR